MTRRLFHAFVPTWQRDFSVRSACPEPVPNRRRVMPLCLCVFLFLSTVVLPHSAAAQERDYLTTVEADKIRDAEYPDLRIKLFIEFAQDRLTKFKYELGRGKPDRQRSIRLLALVDAYMGCIDDAAELVEIGRLRQHDIRKGIEELEKRSTEFLAELEALHKATPDDAAYKETLGDAILSTKEAHAEALKAKDEIAPPPVRRKP